MQGAGLGGLEGGAGAAGGVRVNSAGIVEGLVLSHASSYKEGAGVGSGAGAGADAEDADAMAEGGDEGEGGAGDEGHPPALLRPGPVRLAEVRRELNNAGVETRLAGGAVVTAGGVVVRRGADAFALEMDGPVCAEYFEVRRVLYSLFVVA
jgi:hypothetical protein